MASYKGTEAWNIDAKKHVVFLEMIGQSFSTILLPVKVKLTYLIYRSTKLLT